MELEVKNDIVKMMVMGIGGAGNSVVNRIVQEKIESTDSVEYVVVNTDRQALDYSNVKDRLLIGSHGTGAGADPLIGEEAARESEEAIKNKLRGVELLFITAGMGGGTGTGASPVIAEIAKKMGMLVIAVVSTPFAHEAKLRIKKAEQGIEKLREFVDALIIIDNAKLKDVVDLQDSMNDVMKLADDPLRHGIEGIARTILEYGNEINTDFADIKSIMSNKGLAHMGIGVSSSKKDAGIEATKKAIESNLTNTSIRGATGVLFNICSSNNLSYGEYLRMSEMVEELCSDDVNLIQGKTVDDAMGDEVRVTIIATGIRNNRDFDRKYASPEAVASRRDPRGDSGSGAPVYTNRRGDRIPTPRRQSEGLKIPKDF